MRETLMGLPKAVIIALFEHLNGGNAGFDHARLKKSPCVNRLLERHSEEDIRAAMMAVGAQDGEADSDDSDDSDDSPKANLDEKAISKQIAGLFTLLASSAVNEAKVKHIVDAAISEAVARLVNRIELVTPESKSPTDCGIQHVRFPDLLKACNARLRSELDAEGNVVLGKRLNVWLTGPAGSGKTTAAKMVAKAFGLKFYFNGAVAQQYELLGFIDGAGRYHETEFRRAWEKGGVYIFDEVDGSDPRAVLAFNAALANGICAFPDRTLERHEACIILAGANTSGNGGTSDFTARQKQDAAFIDRFVELQWVIDEALELAISSNQAWCKRVQGVRARVAARGIKGHMITPRATAYGEALLAAGLSMDTVEKMTLKKGLSDAAWDQIK